MKNRIESLSDDELLSRTSVLVAQSRRLEAERVAHLAEVDARRLYLGEACPSMFVYATSRLGLSEAEAYLRITVARVSRRFPAAVRRAVWQRDGAQCTFVDATGRRCPATEQLEFHHETPFARGGDHSLGNVRLLCRGHNGYRAELDFGAAVMRDRIAVARAGTRGSGDHPT